MQEKILQQSIEFIKGVGPNRAKMIEKELGIRTFGQLLNYFPYRYVDRTSFHKIRSLHGDMPYVQVKAMLVGFKEAGFGKTQRLIGIFRDDSGELEVVWFKGAKWIIKKLVVRDVYVIFGKPTSFNGKINMSHPEIEHVIDYEKSGAFGIQPMYNVTENLKKNFVTSKILAKITYQLITYVKERLPETLTEYIINKHQLIPFKEAITQIHFPDTFERLAKATYRLKFEELFYIQLRLLHKMEVRKKQYAGFVFEKVGNIFNDFYQKNLPFELTNAQKRVIKEIRADMKTGTQMNRLLQGDVGSGKTLVALMCMLLAIDNGYQAAMMAPTEILANQHLATIVKMLDGLNVNVELLTGSTKTAKRREIDQGLLDGSIHIIIGTHALIEERVKFRNLGFVVIDEQHRFGVAQRAKMWKKNNTPPHVLVMTATPIPRSLTMTLYGDMDYSVIDELPPGRKSVKTFHMRDSDRLKIFGFMKKQIEIGRQIYIVYPLIEESQKLDLKDLMDGYESISRAFPLPKYKLSIVHGRMKNEEKDFEMQRFVKGETQIMVSTTVIEVGVDVPNATVMIIENAERFGLSQLHQLRGRVGRGGDQSYCILVTKDQLSSDGRTRIGTMVRTNDGFEVARVDLKLRGPGEMEGTQQSGVQHLKLSDLVKDKEILQEARATAGEILHNDAALEKEENRCLKNIVTRNRQSNHLSWSDIL